MYRVVLKARFRKDYARCARRGLPIAKVDAAIRLLASGATPPPAMLDHPLKGDNAGARELHLRGNWLLTYRRDQQRLVLEMLRTGIHDELGLGS